MSIVEEKLLEKLKLLDEEQLNELENEIDNRLVKVLSQLDDEDFDKMEILIKTLAIKDKNKALDLAKESTMNCINCIENDDIYYIVEIQIIKACLYVINDKKLIDKYQNLDKNLVKELLIDLNDTVLE